MDKQTTTLELNINGKDARAELEKLNKRASDLKDTWASLAKEKGIDSKACKAVQREIQKTEAEARKMQKTMVQVNNVLAHLDTATPDQLNRALKELNRELNSGNIERGSQQWKEYQNQLRLVSAEINKIKLESKESKSWVDKFNDGMSKWGNVLAGVAAAAAGVYMALSSFRDKASAKEEAQANLKALTGLDDENIQWLTKQAEELSTTMASAGLRIRQSSDEILQAYMLVGSNKPELLTDKEALNSVTIEALRLANAAGLDVKTAVDSVTSSLNQYGASADEAAKYVNVLAAGSKVGAADVSKVNAVVLRAGVAANMAKIPIEGLVGATEALAEKGLKGERAGTGLKTFLLKLEAGAEQTRPSVVGLNQALENLAQMNMSTADMTKKFGLSAVNVASNLIELRGQVDYYTKAVTDTKVAEEQAAIVSQTAAAKRAQLSNKLNELGIQLMNDLNPAIMSVTGKIVNWTRALVNFIEWANKHRATITTLILSIAAYNVVMNYHVIKQKLVVFWNNMIIASLKKLKIAFMSNPWGILAVALATAIAYMYDYFSSLEKLTAKQKNLLDGENKIKEKYNEEYAKVNMLHSALSNENIAREKKLQIIDKLKKIIPGYNAELDQEGKLVRENTASIDEYLKRMRARAEMQVWQEQYQEIYKSYTDVQNQIDELIKKQRSGKYHLGIDGGESRLSKLKEQAKGYKDALDAIMDKIESIIAKSDVLPSIGMTDSDDENQEDPNDKRIKLLEVWLAKEEEELTRQYQYKIISEEEYEQAIYNLEYEFLNKKQQLYAIDSKEWLAVEKDKAEKSKERIIKLIKEEQDADKKLQKEQEDDEKRQEKLADKLNKEWSRLHQSATSMVNKYAPAEESVESEINKAKELLEKRMISQEQYDKIISALEQKRSNAVLAQYDKENEHINKSYRERQADLKNMCDQGKITYEDYTKRKEELDNEWKESLVKALETFSNSFQQILSNLSSYYSACQDLEVNKAEKSWDAKIEAAENAGKDTSELEEQKEQEIAAIKSKYNDKAMKIEIASAIAQGAQAVINAYSSAAAIPYVGFIMAPIAAAMAAASVALQIAAIKKQHAAEKAGYYEGGYTYGNAYHKEAGVVHEGEFVANHEAVNNPSLRNVFDLVDQAQRNNAVGAITAEDIAMANARQSGATFARGGYTSNISKTSSTPSIVVQRDDNYTRLANAIELLCNEGVEAVVSMTGKNGIVRKTQQYNRYNANKSR